MARLTGHFLAVGYETVDDGSIAMQSDGVFHVFPLSLGIETDQEFRNANAIVELGWTPFNPQPLFEYGDTAYKLGVNPRFGLFVPGRIQVLGRRRHDQPAHRQCGRRER